MEPDDSIPHSQGFPIISILKQINSIRRIDTYFFKTYFVLFSHLRLALPKGLFFVNVPLNILKGILPAYILGKSSRFSRSDYIR
jgi:hypothetical protein